MFGSRAAIVAAMVWVVAGGCRGGEDERAKAARKERPETRPEAKPEPKPDAPAGEEKRYTVVEGEPALVLFIVVDTVRADHLAACGYDRPTSSTFERLKERGAVVSCNAYSPASWTLPSHASYFTGRLVAEHGLELAPESALAVNPHVNVRPLPPEAETLAERMKARGYQTAFLSGNPIIKGETGLHQGFDLVKVADPSNGGLRDEALIAELRKLLREAKRDQPLFVFVNVYDAHDPYPAVPVRVDWLPNRAELRISPTQSDETNDFWRFYTDKMNPKERGAWLAHLRDAYDWGVHEADRNVGRVVEAMRDLGFSDRGVRLVVTADHGELLGEHGLLRHGGYVYEGVVKVPFLLLDTTQATQPTLPAEFSATQAFYLLSDGKLDPTAAPPTSISSPNPSFFQKGVSAVAVWQGRDKGVWEEGQSWRVNLATDPKEAEKLAIDGALKTELDRQKAAFDEMNARPVPSNEGMTSALQAMGYVQ